MTFHYITIFPHIFDSYIHETLLKRAQDKKKVTIHIEDLRTYTTDKHKNVDDRPYGGGPGMVMKVEPWYTALQKIMRRNVAMTNARSEYPKKRVILFSPAGKQFTQHDAKRMLKYDALIFVCGRYEGIDARVEKFVDEKISVGPYILSGGELPALIITEAITRLIPGVLGNEESLSEETFEKTNAEYPQYTKPETFTTTSGTAMNVPPVLLSGNHKKIAEWRKKNSR